MPTNNLHPAAYAASLRARREAILSRFNYDLYERQDFSTPAGYPHTLRGTLQALTEGDLSSEIELDVRAPAGAGRHWRFREEFRLLVYSLAYTLQSMLDDLVVATADDMDSPPPAWRFEGTNGSLVNQFSGLQSRTSASIACGHLTARCCRAISTYRDYQDQIIERLSPSKCDASAGLLSRSSVPSGRHGPVETLATDRGCLRAPRATDERGSSRAKSGRNDCTLNRAYSSRPVESQGTLSSAGGQTALVWSGQDDKPRSSRDTGKVSPQAAGPSTSLKDLDAHPKAHRHALIRGDRMRTNAGGPTVVPSDKTIRCRGSRDTEKLSPPGNGTVTEAEDLHSHSTAPRQTSADGVARVLARAQTVVLSGVDVKSPSSHSAAKFLSQDAGPSTNSKNLDTRSEANCHALAQGDRLRANAGWQTAVSSCNTVKLCRAHSNGKHAPQLFARDAVAHPKPVRSSSDGLDSPKESRLMSSATPPFLSAHISPDLSGTSSREMKARNLRDVHAPPFQETPIRPSGKSRGQVLSLSRDDARVTAPSAPLAARAIDPLGRRDAEAVNSGVLVVAEDREQRRKLEYKRSGGCCIVSEKRGEGVSCKSLADARDLMSVALPRRFGEKPTSPGASAAGQVTVSLCAEVSSRDSWGHSAQSTDHTCYESPAQFLDLNGLCHALRESAERLSPSPSSAIRVHAAREPPDKATSNSSGLPTSYRSPSARVPSAAPLLRSCRRSTSGSGPDSTNWRAHGQRVTLSLPEDNILDAGLRSKSVGEHGRAPDIFDLEEGVIKSRDASGDEKGPPQHAKSDTRVANLHHPRSEVSTQASAQHCLHAHAGGQVLTSSQRDGKPGRSRGARKRLPQNARSETTEAVPDNPARARATAEPCAEISSHDPRDTVERSPPSAERDGEDEPVQLPDSGHVSRPSADRLSPSSSAMPRINVARETPDKMNSNDSSLHSGQSTPRPRSATVPSATPPFRSSHPSTSKSGPDSAIWRTRGWLKASSRQEVSAVEADSRNIKWLSPRLDTVDSAAPRAFDLHFHAFERGPIPERPEDDASDMERVHAGGQTVLSSCKDVKPLDAREEKEDPPWFTASDSEGRRLPSSKHNLATPSTCGRGDFALGCNSLPLSGREAEIIKQPYELGSGAEEVHVFAVPSTHGPPNESRVSGFKNPARSLASPSSQSGTRDSADTLRIDSGARDLAGSVERAHGRNIAGQMRGLSRGDPASLTQQIRLLSAHDVNTPDQRRPANVPAVDRICFKSEVRDGAEYNSHAPYKDDLRATPCNASRGPFPAVSNSLAMREDNGDSTRLATSNRGHAPSREVESCTKGRVRVWGLPMKVHNDHGGLQRMSKHWESVQLDLGCKSKSSLVAFDPRYAPHALVMNVRSSALCSSRAKRPDVLTPSLPRGPPDKQRGRDVKALRAKKLPDVALLIDVNTAVASVLGCAVCPDTTSYLEGEVSSTSEDESRVRNCHQAALLLSSPTHQQVAQLSVPQETDLRSPECLTCVPSRTKPRARGMAQITYLRAGGSRISRRVGALPRSNLKYSVEDFRPLASGNRRVTCWIMKAAWRFPSTPWCRDLARLEKMRVYYKARRSEWTQSARPRLLWWMMVSHRQTPPLAFPPEQESGGQVSRDHRAVYDILCAQYMPRHGRYDARHIDERLDQERNVGPIQNGPAAPSSSACSLRLVSSLTTTPSRARESAGPPSRSIRSPHVHLRRFSSAQHLGRISCLTPTSLAAIYLACPSSGLYIRSTPPDPRVCTANGGAQGEVPPSVCEEETTSILARVWWLAGCSHSLDRGAQCSKEFRTAPADAIGWPKGRQPKSNEGYRRIAKRWQRTPTRFRTSAARTGCVILCIVPDELRALHMSTDPLSGRQDIVAHNDKKTIPGLAKQRS